MCGIAGTVTDGPPASHRLLDAQLRTLVHRGPDAAHAFVDGPVALGMRRLAIIDPEGGAQPLRSEDGSVVLVGNGEVYGFRALREELRRRGHRFAAGSDLEVAVHLYEDYGEAFLDHLPGMWALALWDARRRVLLLARDRLGKKPLVWAAPSPHRLTFGSDARTVLVDPDVRAEPDPAALDACCVLQHLPPDRTAWRGVHRLGPGQVLTWTPGRPAHVRTWWRPPTPAPRVVSMRTAAGELRDLLRDVTAERLVSDVPLGAFLSGGLDSSVVVAAMAQSAQAPVKTFAARFAEAGFDEGPWARAVAEHWGTEHHELEVGPVDLERLHVIARHLGEPLADPAVVPAYGLAEAARAHVRVALTGDGGDELLAGYRRHGRMTASRPAEAVPPALRAAAAAVVGGRGRLGRTLQRAAEPPPRRYAATMRHFSDDDRVALYGDRLRGQLASGRPLRVVEDAWAASGSGPWTERLLAVDRAVYLPGDLLPKADLTSMAHGLELRSPLLDTRLLDWAATLPPHLKRRGATGKRVLRAAAAPWLPPAVLERRKQGFAVPVDAWVRGPLRPGVREVLLDAGARESGLFDPLGVARCLRELDAGAPRATTVWTMLTVQLWWRTCVAPSRTGVMAA